MESATKFVTALSELLGVLAWPIVIAAIFYFVRMEARDALSKLPPLIERMKSLKLGAFEAELNALADKSAVGGNKKGDVTGDQVSLAASLKVQSRVVGASSIVSELDKLAIEYDTIRGAMQAGPERTRRMTRIVVQMRALSPSASDMIDAYKSSGSPGSRLVAIAMMQMEPQRSDLGWLEQRFKIENPFVFYHAALALQNAVHSLSGPRMQAATDVARQAFETVKSFDGVPDGSTLEVLQPLLR